MARVFIDGHMFSEAWFKKILPELVANELVFFSYGASTKLSEEHSKMRNALAFYKAMGDLKTKNGRQRRDDADEQEISYHMNAVVTSRAYKSCAACDDPRSIAGRAPRSPLRARSLVRSRGWRLQVRT